jgi:hypothetical protein
MHTFRPSEMFRALMKGKATHGSSWLPKRRTRHRTAQMKFFSSSKYKNSAANSMWGFANKQAKKYKGSGWTGIN